MVHGRGRALWRAAGREQRGQTLRRCLLKRLAPSRREEQALRRVENSHRVRQVLSGRWAGCDTVHEKCRGLQPFYTAGVSLYRVAAWRGRAFAITL